MTRLILVALALSLSSIASGQNVGLGSLSRLTHFETRRESSSNEDLHKNGDARPIEPGETLVLGELEGPGAITHLWCTVGSEDIFYPRSLVLRIYWDGADKPSVEAPLGDFFGVGHGAHVDFTSLPVTVTSNGRARNCFWEMPFRKSAKVTVTNDSKQFRTDSFYYYLDWRRYDHFPEDGAYFHAEYRQQMPAEPGDYTIAEIEGRGHYVGTVYSSQHVELGWFGEGDDRFYIDGQEMPELRGTGTEDYFNDAWGFRQFSTPYYGVSLWEGYFPGDRATAYRWHLDNPVAFTKSLKVAIEHKGSIFTDDATHLGQFIERPDWISSVAFWYQAEPAAVQAVLPAPEKRIAPYRTLKPAELEIRADPPQLLQKSEGGFNYVPGKPDASVELDFEVEQAGRYQINAVMTYGIFSGVYAPFLDGEAIRGPIDFARTGIDPIWTRFDLHDLDMGKHTLRFVGRGPSPNKRTLAPDYNGLAMQRLILLRLEDVDGYHRAMEETLKSR